MSEDKILEDVLNNNETKRLKFPYEINKLDETTNSELLQLFTGEKTGFVQVGPKKYFFPSGYEKEAENYYNFKSRPEDIWILTYPRSGTTWSQEMFWLLANDLNFKKAKTTLLTERSQFFEFSSFVHPLTKAQLLKDNEDSVEKCTILQDFDKPGWEVLNTIKGPRFIKTHLPFSLLPPNLLETGCKIVYVARNPKDVAVSFYHLNRSIRTQGYIGDFPTYWKCFQNNLQPWTPYWEHLEEAWQRRNHPNVLFMFYDELNKIDLRGGLKRAAKFLGKSYTESQYEELEEHLKIENFRKNPAVNSQELKDLKVLIEGEEGFVRKGQTGGWKAYFNQELSAQADQWIQENLAKTDLRFPQV